MGGSANTYVSGNKDLPAKGASLVECSIFSIFWLGVMVDLNDSWFICHFSHKVLLRLWTET